MAEAQKRPENLVVNLICNIAIPTVILMKFSSDKWLGPVWGLIVALIFPLGYGLWDFIQRRETNLFSIIGFFSVLLSGGLGLLKVGGIWFAIKDAAVPLVMGAAVLVSLKTKKPLVRTVLLNDQILDVPRVETALAERGQWPAFEKLLVNASLGLAASFVLVAVLHFALVFHILKSPPGTPEFNAELGRVHGLSLVVVGIPSMLSLMLVLWRVVSRLEALSGLTGDEIFKGEKPKEKS
ncbi:MAG TPA: VC0807 family protein [Opitutaceae bacterium]|nr:VC0807 family protein [Opitutaceae bacterium]